MSFADPKDVVHRPDESAVFQILCANVLMMKQMYAALAQVGA
ncbi:hypothetical protein [Rathayibacter toxicus]|nr:hypothetical protein [Rathayibacter toxicus]